MSLIIVKTFADRNSYVAVAHYEGQIIAKGGVGSGHSERSAAQEAINSLFEREDERSRAVQPLLGQPGVLACTFDENAAKPPTDDFGLSDDIFASQPIPPAVSTSQRGDFGKGEFVGHAAIREKLAWAIASKATGDSFGITIHYTDARGNSTVRNIDPIELKDNEERRFGSFRIGGEMLVAIDLDKDEPRHFKVDRIDKLVIA
jgi:hypothetical protein